MTHYICRALMPLASRTEQERYIVHGTSEEYLLPAELLDQAASVVDAVDGDYPWAKRLGSGERAAVLAFGAVLRSEAQAVDLAQDGEALVNRCPAWERIRQAAGACLAALGCEAVAEAPGAGAGAEAAASAAQQGAAPDRHCANVGYSNRKSSAGSVRR